MCVRGASALDELLAEFPNARIHVLVVWVPVLKSDIAAPITKSAAALPVPISPPPAPGRR